MNDGNLKILLKKVKDLYFRKCCWDYEKPCDTCREFQRLYNEALYSMRLTKRKEK